MNPTLAEASTSGGSSTSDFNYDGSNTSDGFSRNEQPSQWSTTVNVSDSDKENKTPSAWKRLISKNYERIRMSLSEKDGIYSGMISASRSDYIALNKREIKWLSGRLHEAVTMGSKSAHGIFCTRRSLEYEISKRSTRPAKMNNRKLHIKQIIRETGRPEVRREITISGVEKIDFIVESLKEFNIKMNDEEIVNIE